MANLVDGLIAQMNRNRELIKLYEEAGPVGAFKALSENQA